MSDYAGPILGVVGAVIGGMTTFGTGAQWGYAIGSAIGGMYAQSQQVIPGPKIGDVQKQTAQEGGFRPIVYGRSNPIRGNCIADGGPVIVKRRESSKGGPKVESESAFRTYAVGFCEGEAGLLQAWKNGTLVYDVEDPSMGPENAKFLEYATWYTGTFDQAASPDLESIYGAGQAPYFRGTAYLSIHEEDVTDQRGAWSQWQVRVFRGAAKSYTTPPYPVLVVDSIGVSSAARDGIMWQPPMDEMDVYSHALDGVKRELVLYYSTQPEEIDVSSVALNGIKRALVQRYTSPAEEINVASVALSGTKKIIVVRYPHYAPEEIDVTSFALDGIKRTV